MNARCAVHPDAAARAAPCRRCGSFACETCFEHPEHDLCPACSEATGELASDLRLEPKVRDRHRWIRKNPRLAGLAYVGFGLLMNAMNVAMLVGMERYYVVLFPAGCAMMGLGTALMITGRMADRRAPAWHKILSGALLLGGLALGIGLDFLVG